MRIALVSQISPPQPAVASHRVLRLTRTLLAAGHDVHWVTLDPTTLLATDPTLTRWIPPDVRMHALGGPTLYSHPKAPSFSSKILRTLAYELPKRLPLFDGHFEWTRRLKRRLPSIVADHELDAVLVCCGPHGQIAALPGLRHSHPHLRLFADYRDLLSGNPWNERSRPAVRERLRRRERRALAAADTLFVNTRIARERFLEVVGPIDGVEIDVMRNAADYDLADEIIRAAPAEPLGPGCHLGFFGTLFPQRRLREVLRAMAKLDAETLSRVTLHCYCDDNQSPPILAADLAEAGPAIAARVERHPFLPYEAAIVAMHAMSALVLVNSPDARDAVFVPGKLYDYLMARRPILFVGSAGDASQIVTDCGGTAFAYGEADALATEIRRVAATPSREPLAANLDYGAERTFAPLLDRISR